MLARKKAMLMNAGTRPRTSHSLFMTLKNGLGEMVDAVIKKSPNIQFKSGVKVAALEKKEDGWHVKLGDGSECQTDAIILATPGGITAKIIKPIAPDSAELLDRIHYVSTATVTLGYKKEGFSHSLDGFGFVVPKAEGRSILACTWTSSKFPHRTPEGYVMLRCYLGGALQEEIAEKDTETLETLVRNDLQKIMGINEAPIFCKVFQNHKSNVQYHVNHSERIDCVMEDLKKFPGLFLAGSAYRGIGIPDCIQNGNQAAESACDFLNGKSHVSV
tara:strand:- start:61 stop:882 length:822 start_codon:yes stop_codon:yes gene_type:complete